MRLPEVSYARSGDVAIAYQVVGEGPLDIVFVRGALADLLAAWEQPLFVRHVEGIAAFGRVILFDKRGSGLSDPVRQVPTLEARMDDVRAVLDAVGADRAAIWAGQEGTRIAAMFAATYPERTLGLVLYDPSARGLWAPDYPWAPTDEEWMATLREMREHWGERPYLRERLRAYSPTVADDEAFQDWFVWYMRRSASPAEAVAFNRMAMEGDVREVLPAVRCPTLVLHRPKTRAEATFVAESIPGAERIEVEGLLDSYSWASVPANEFMLAETGRFLGALGVRPASDRVLATILFTDIIASTEHAARLGDRGWSELLVQHHAVVRNQLTRFRGQELDTAGDGFFAAFDGPGRAVQCAAAIRAAVRPLGLEIRAGVHTGEFERVGGKLGGIGVATGARIAALAGPGEVLVSSTVKELVAGSEIEFEDRGVHELKGVPGEWRLYASVG
jgi:class 3 adenylate cyclase/pimeloyl-ACP methyl ester carboxylesterase